MDAEKIQTDIDALLTYMNDDMENLGSTVKTTVFGFDAGQDDRGLAPIFSYTFYHLIHYWFADVDISVTNNIPMHCVDAIRSNVQSPSQGSLPLLTRLILA